MRLAALILSVLFGVSTISVVQAAPKKMAKPAQQEDLNANGKKLVWDGLPLIMPSAVMFWMLHNKEVEAKKEAEAKKTQVKAQARPKKAAAQPKV